MNEAARNREKIISPIDEVALTLLESYLKKLFKSQPYNNFSFQCVRTMLDLKDLNAKTIEKETVCITLNSPDERNSGKEIESLLEQAGVEFYEERSPEVTQYFVLTVDFEQLLQQARSFISVESGNPSFWNKDLGLSGSESDNNSVVSNDEKSFTFSEDATGYRQDPNSSTTYEISASL